MTKREVAREQIQLEVLGEYDTSGSINVSNLKTNLQNNLGIDVSNFGRKLPSGTITLDGYNFYIDKDGEVIYGENERNTGEILSEIVTSDNYGDYVDYSIDLNEDGDTTNDWRIFYNDGEHVFLIAADYVKSDSSYLDLDAAEMYRCADYDSSRIYSLNWYNSETNSSTLSTHTGNPSIDSDVAALFMYNIYYKAYPNASYDNTKATSSLLDVEAWAGFVDDAYASYAVGGATLEMWAKSYNEKGYPPIEVGLGKKEELGYGLVNEYDFTASNTGYEDELYFPHQEEQEGSYGYYLASPDGRIYSNCMVDVSCDGWISDPMIHSQSDSVRPVVCMRSSVLGEWDEDNFWFLSN